MSIQRQRLHEKVLQILKRAHSRGINSKNKKLKLLTKEERGSYENAEIIVIFALDIGKLEIIVIIQKNIEVMRIAYLI